MNLAAARLRTGSVETSDHWFPHLQKLPHPSAPEKKQIEEILVSE